MAKHFIRMYVDSSKKKINGANYVGVGVNLEIDGKKKKTRYALRPDLPDLNCRFEHWGAVHAMLHTLKDTGFNIEDVAFEIRTDCLHVRDLFNAYLEEDYLTKERNVKGDYVIAKMVHTFATKLRNFKVCWIPRDHNQRSDAVSKEQRLLLEKVYGRNLSAFNMAGSLPKLTKYDKPIGY